ncbi:Flap-structured DNA-binding and RNA-binding protein [Marasmius crinis-equi]|uniref:Flap-structured DNA-binding and RNA-binding protein n=1 Tax=Marasmius crinis-equi TaxID=585013 RepID=A0ABR3FWX8_9AGAR
MVPGAMAAASEEPKFREELGTIEQWFTLLNDSEQDATLYSLIQHASQEQLTFLKAVLQQLSDPVGDNSRQSSPATTRPPLNVRLPGTPRTPGFSLASALSPSTSQSRDQHDKLDKSAIAAAAAMASPLSATDQYGQEIFIKHDENSWANMVNTPMDLMFKKPQKSAQGPNIPLGMANPMLGMSMMNPLAFNQGMAGYGNEAQLLALQLMMNGMTMQPQQQQPPSVGNSNQKSGAQQQRQQQKGQSSGSGNWRSAPTARGSSKATPSKPKSTASSSSAAAAAVSPTTRPEDDVDPELLKDIPAWLKTLRLHKYTDAFKGMTWQDMVVLDEDQLEKMGVTALGARRRLTKNFEAVKRKMGMAPADDDGATPAEEAPKDTTS